jgi:hypothetical protein
MKVLGAMSAQRHAVRPKHRLRLVVRGAEFCRSSFERG